MANRVEQDAEGEGGRRREIVKCDQKPTKIRRSAPTIATGLVGGEATVS
jgi:hypothetical protein